ncbi:MAG: hypothetical protein AAF667_07735 [Pseudomonadota bacterium]
MNDFAKVSIIFVALTIIGVGEVNSMDRSICHVGAENLSEQLARREGSSSSNVFDGSFFDLLPEDFSEETGLTGNTKVFIHGSLCPDNKLDRVVFFRVVDSIVLEAGFRDFYSGEDFSNRGIDFLAANFRNSDDLVNALNSIFDLQDGFKLGEVRNFINGSGMYLHRKVSFQGEGRTNWIFSTLPFDRGSIEYELGLHMTPTFGPGVSVIVDDSTERVLSLEIPPNIHIDWPLYSRQNQRIIDGAYDVGD